MRSVFPPDLLVRNTRTQSDRSQVYLCPMSQANLLCKSAKQFPSLITIWSSLALIAMLPARLVKAYTSVQSLASIIQYTDIEFLKADLAVFLNVKNYRRDPEALLVVLPY